MGSYLCECLGVRAHSVGAGPSESRADSPALGFRLTPSGRVWIRFVQGFGSDLGLTIRVYWALMRCPKDRVSLLDSNKTYNASLV